MEEEVWRERVKKPIAFAGVEVLLGFETVIFREDRGEMDLRGD